jgi:hypothetical protein
VLTDVPNGVGSLSQAEVGARHQRVADAVGSQAPERTIPAVSLSDGVVTESRVGAVPTSAETPASSG